MNERLAILTGGVILALVVGLYVASVVHSAFTHAAAQVECIRDPATCPTTSQ